MNEEELLKEVGLYNKRFIAVVKNGFVYFIQDKKDKNNGILFMDRDVIKALTEVKEKYQEENIGFYNEGFQKGKLEQKKEDKNKQDEFYNEFDLASNCSKDDKLFKKLWNKYFKQLQKEIGKEKEK